MLVHLGLQLVPVLLQCLTLALEGLPTPLILTQWHCPRLIRISSPLHLLFQMADASVQLLPTSLQFLG